MNKQGFISLITKAVECECLKKLVLSKPESGEITRVSARLCAHRGKRILAFEYSLPGNTVSHKNVTEGELAGELDTLISSYRQVNLITTMGDAEYKRGRESEVVLRGDMLLRKMSGDTPLFESAIESLDRQKNYILSGSEEFLIRLGISSRDGRVHDKKQGKFRQINKFLEHIEEIYPEISKNDEINIFDLCCGKSYLSFAVYHYLTNVKGKRVQLLGVDLKRDVILWCESLAREIGFHGMRFEVGDITKLSTNESPDMVISLHACDIATDVVLDTAARLSARVILSTPCCHRYLNGKVVADELSFVTENPHIANKLCEALTDSLRVLRLKSFGYNVTVSELTDPENTPKNTLIRAVRSDRMSEKARAGYREQYDAAKSFLMKDGAAKYLSEIR